MIFPISSSSPSFLNEFESKNSKKTDNGNNPFKPMNNLNLQSKDDSNKCHLNNIRDFELFPSFSVSKVSEEEDSMKRVMKREKDTISPNNQYNIKSIIFEDSKVYSTESLFLKLEFVNNKYPQGTFDLFIKVIKTIQDQKESSNDTFNEKNNRKNQNDFDCHLMDIKEIIYYCDQDDLVCMELTFFTNNDELKRIVHEFNCSHTLKINLDHKMTNQLNNQIHKINSNKIKSSIILLSGKRDKIEESRNSLSDNNNSFSTCLNENEAFVLIERDKNKDEKGNGNGKTRIENKKETFGDYSNRLTLPLRMKSSRTSVKLELSQSSPPCSLNLLSSSDHDHNHNYRNKKIKQDHEKSLNLNLNSEKEENNFKDEYPGKGKSLFPLKSHDSDNLLFIYEERIKNSDNNSNHDSFSSSIAIHQSDYNRLDSSNYLNDVIIDWDLGRMWDDSPIGDSIYIFNSFFYKKLKYNHSHYNSPFNPSKIPIKEEKDENERGERGGNFWELAKPWTNKINIFKRDILMIPICENLHWYLLCVWKPGNLLINSSRDNNDKNNRSNMTCQSDKIPDDSNDFELNDVNKDSIISSSNSTSTIIYCFDSLGRRRLASCRKLDHFLHDEAFYRYSIDTSPGSIEYKFPRMPLQTNLYDCGCFLLQTAQEILASCRIETLNLENVNYSIDRVMDRRQVLKSIMESMKEQWIKMTLPHEMIKEEEKEEEKFKENKIKKENGGNKNCIEIIEI